MRFKDAPIGRKLTLLLSLTSATALVLASAALVSYDLLSFREDMARELETIATVVASNVTAPLLFDDVSAAEEGLAALRAEQQIRRAVLLRGDGRVLAEFRSPERVSSPLGAWPEADGHLFQQDRLRLRHSVLLEGDSVGTLLIESDMS